MVIRMEDIAGQDFSDVADGERIGPVTPGDVLREELMVPLSLPGCAPARERAYRPSASPGSWRVSVPSRLKWRSWSASGSACRRRAGRICRWHVMWGWRDGIGGMRRNAVILEPLRHHLTQASIGGIGVPDYA